MLVVEDEPAVREGLEVLLKGWGAERPGVRHRRRVEAWAAPTPSRALPDLLIVDYRLQSGHTGIEAISALRAASVPACRRSSSPAA